MQQTVVSKIASAAYIFFFTMFAKESLQAKLYLFVCLLLEVRSGCERICQDPRDQDLINYGSCELWWNETCCTCANVWGIFCDISS